MTQYSIPILSEEITTELTYACRPDVGQGIGTRVKHRPSNASSGVEFDVGPCSGIFVGAVPNSDFQAPDLLFSERESPADGYLYVYIADIEHYKEGEEADLTANYADLRLESSLFATLSDELLEIVESVFDIHTDEIRLERYPHDGGGVYFLIPLPPEPMGE